MTNAARAKASAERSPARLDPGPVRAEAPARPPSATDMRISLVGVAGLLAATAALRGIPAVGPIDAVVVCMVAYVVPVAALEATVLRTWNRPSTGLDYSRPLTFDFARSGTKLLGLLTTLCVIMLAYSLFPEYTHEFYQPFWDVLSRWGWVAVLVALPYFVVVDALMSRPRDGYWHVGALMLGREEGVDPGILLQHFLGWLVKAFFLPIMFVFFQGNLAAIRDFDLSAGTFQGAFDFLWLVIHFADVAVGVVGYCMTLRVLDSHIRSAEPTLAGWVVGIVCYPPFIGVIEQSYVLYDDDLNWWAWLEGHPALRAIWGGIILAFAVIYASATVVFGLRFSNLTHRGIITGGPYRVVRHPAYISKLIVFAMVSVPFVSSRGWLVASANCARWAMLAGIYWLRAWTEERHLSRDADYRVYVASMERVGLTAVLRRRLGLGGGGRSGGEP